MRAVVSGVVVVLLVWAVLVAGLLVRERQFIFSPSRVLEAKPTDYGLNAEELRVVSADGTALHGWWIHGQGERVLIWYQGNAGNISHRLETARVFVERLGVDIVLVDYRGYGLSEGTPEETGLYVDGLAIYDATIRRGFDPERLLLFGRSLGAAVAVEVALNRPAAGLVLETPFRSVRAMARSMYPFVPSFLIRTRLDNEGKISQIRMPKLILHGDRDNLVPISHGRTLFELALPPKRFFAIPGASHNDTHVVDGRGYFEAWEQFLSETGLGSRSVRAGWPTPPPRGARPVDSG